MNAINNLEKYCPDVIYLTHENILKFLVISICAVDNFMFSLKNYTACVKEEKWKTKAEHFPKKIQSFLSSKILSDE